MANTTNFGWETPDDTDLVKDGAAAMRTLGNAIDTSLVDLKGGTTGQVLSKTSNTDMDFTWVTSDDANAIQNAIVDAKGDLISATAADTPARLAVGNNGETLVADSSTSTGLRYNPQNALANPIINGGMDIWQRGTSIAVTANTFLYTADRWCAYRNVSGMTVSRQTISDSTNLPNIQYALRVQRDSGNTSTVDSQIVQSIETTNSIPYAGKTVTFSFYARAGANYSPTSSALLVQIATGTGTDQNLGPGFTGQTYLHNANVTLTTTWQRFAITVNVGSTATQMGVRFIHNPTGTAGANDWFEVTGTQIDLGTYTASSAPTFRRSGGTLAGELAACQRYYCVYINGNNCPIGAGWYPAAGTMVTQLIHPVEMRTSPTLSQVTGTNYYNIYAVAGNDNFNSFTLDIRTTRQTQIYNNTQMAGTAGSAGGVASINASAFLALDAEL